MLDIKSDNEKVEGGEAINNSAENVEQNQEENAENQK